MDILIGFRGLHRLEQDFNHRKREDRIVASRAKTVRADQKAYWEEKLNQRLSLLADQGAEPRKVARDTTVRQLRAKLRETEKRLQSIEEKEKKLEELARVKAERLAAPKKKEKKKTAAEEKAAESKRQQKKRKKKEGKGKG
ncbi:MAG TPA: hypothetical protein ENH37_00290 [Deltaproteobacteria bacterium]|nr:hypothetical protein [Deltaproteobacteria bacterium]